jgi:hypothetical protein
MTYDRNILRELSQIYEKCTARKQTHSIANRVVVLNVEDKVHHLTSLVGLDFVLVVSKLKSPSVRRSSSVFIDSTYLLAAAQEKVALRLKRPGL